MRPQVTVVHESKLPDLVSMHTSEKEEGRRERTSVRISSFARKLMAEWKRLRLPVHDQQVVVAVSGGADSTALLLALNELVRAKRFPVRITVAHLDHGLRGEQGEQDALWVNDLAKGMGHGTALERINVRERANESGDNLEQAARRARYQFLLDVAEKEQATTVLTAHTMEDQAETVLLRLMRGSGIEGLGGINPVRMLDPTTQVLLIRPLLRWARRADTESYCHERDVVVRVDAMNQDENFSRVRVRKRLLPLMETFNPRIVEALSRTAAMLQTDSSALQRQAQELLKEAGTEDSDRTTALRVEVIALANVSVRRRALRQWITQVRGDARRLEHVHLLAVERLVFGEKGGRIAELPGGSCVERSRGLLLFHASNDKPKNT
jgi:tRNA(Ile)-lysidine synthase